MLKQVAIHLRQISFQNKFYKSLVGNLCDNLKCTSRHYSKKTNKQDLYFRIYCFKITYKHKRKWEKNVVYELVKTS